MLLEYTVCHGVPHDAPDVRFVEAGITSHLGKGRFAIDRDSLRKVIRGDCMETCDVISLTKVTEKRRSVNDSIVAALEGSKLPP